MDVKGIIDDGRARSRELNILETLMSSSFDALNDSGRGEGGDWHTVRE